MEQNIDQKNSYPIPRIPEVQKFDEFEVHVIYQQPRHHLGKLVEKLHNLERKLGIRNDEFTPYEIINEN